MKFSRLALSGMIICGINYVHADQGNQSNRQKINKSIKNTRKPKSSKRNGISVQSEDFESLFSPCSDYEIKRRKTFRNFSALATTSLNNPTDQDLIDLQDLVKAIQTSEVTSGQLLFDSITTNTPLLEEIIVAVLDGTVSHLEIQDEEKSKAFAQQLGKFTILIAMAAKNDIPVALEKIDQVRNSIISGNTEYPGITIDGALAYLTLVKAGLMDYQQAHRDIQDGTATGLSSLMNPPTGEAAFNLETAKPHKQLSQKNVFQAGADVISENLASMAKTLIYEYLILSESRPDRLIECLQVQKIKMMAPQRRPKIPGIKPKPTNTAGQVAPWAVDFEKLLIPRNSKPLQREYGEMIIETKPSLSERDNSSIQNLRQRLKNLVDRL